MQTAYIRCPHCKGRMITVGHKTLTSHFKQLTATCHTPDCLFSATVHVEIAKTLQPSLRQTEGMGARLAS